MSLRRLLQIQVPPSLFRLFYLYSFPKDSVADCSFSFQDPIGGSKWRSQCCPCGCTACLGSSEHTVDVVPFTWPVSKMGETSLNLSPVQLAWPVTWVKCSNWFSLHNATQAVCKCLLIWYSRAFFFLLPEHLSRGSEAHLDDRKNKPSGSWSFLSRKAERAFKAPSCLDAAPAHCWRYLLGEKMAFFMIWL